ncbi:MAG: RNA methyltransferase [Thermotogae bacterium]|nr:RNA methyltransferase [Thermotogota bacterium]
MLDKIYVALIHYPTYNKHHEVVTTAVTNVDIHDIARVCKTYGIKGYYVVNNLVAQQNIVKRVLRYWLEGFGVEYNHTRTEALENVKLVSFIEDVIKDIIKIEGEKPIFITTSARFHEKKLVSFEEMRKRVRVETHPILFGLGTGWGLAEEVVEMSNFLLEPIRGVSEYNHLSVRAAASIIIDRIISERSDMYG